MRPSRPLRRYESFSYILLNKPYGFLCQFTATAGRKTLADLGPFPKDVYPVGRLDADSEGLLLLTNDNIIKHRLTEPRFGHPRTYLIQVEQIPSEESLEQLHTGVLVGSKRTKPAEISLLAEEPKVPPRPVPIRFRKAVPTAWIEITLREGRNRQVRRMTAAIGHPTLRLIRIRIGEFSLEGLGPGESRNLREEEILELKESLTREHPSKGVERSNAVSGHKKPRRAP